MIGAKEIRLGDFIYYKGKKIEVLPNDIGLLHEYERVFRVNEDYQPIPLTDEILSKCDKVFKQEDLWLLPKDVIIKEIDDHWHLIGYSRRHQKILYVHQMQNLYHSLTGDELAITL